MATSTLKNVYQKNPYLVTRKKQDGTLRIITFGQAEAHFELEGGVAEIWNRIDGKKPLADICHEISQDFKLNPVQVKKETLKFVKQLNELNFIHPKTSCDKWD